MRKDLRFRLRSFEFRRCGKFDKKNRRSLKICSGASCAVTPQNVHHPRHHENGQRLAGNVGLPVTWVLKPKNFRESCRAARPSGYEGNSGADAVQESPTKPAKIQQIGAFELGRFGWCCSEFRHRKGIVRFLHFGFPRFGRARSSPVYVLLAIPAGLDSIVVLIRSENETKCAHLASAVKSNQD